MRRAQTSVPTPLADAYKSNSFAMALNAPLNAHRKTLTKRYQRDSALEILPHHNGRKAERTFYLFVMLSRHSGEDAMPFKSRVGHGFARNPFKFECCFAKKVKEVQLFDGKSVRNARKEQEKKRLKKGKEIFLIKNSELEMKHGELFLSHFSVSTSIMRIDNWSKEQMVPL